MAEIWRLRYELSLRDVAEMLLLLGFDVTHETIRTWEFRFAPLVTERLQARRRGRRSASWYLDETYVKVAGRWCYLYRAIDRDGNLLDSMLSGYRDKHAARRFLRRLLEVTVTRPRSVTTDQHSAYRRAIRWLVGRRAKHRTMQYLNNSTKQSHRGLKQRYYPMLGFGNFDSASRFCSAFDELPDYFRVKRRGRPASRSPISDRCSSTDGDRCGVGDECGRERDLLDPRPSSDRTCGPFNLTGYPGLAIPSRFSSEGLPLSIQIVGVQLAEALVLRVGHTYQQVTDFHLQVLEVHASAPA